MLDARSDEAMNWIGEGKLEPVVSFVFTEDDLRCLLRRRGVADADLDQAVADYRAYSKKKWETRER